MAARRGEYRLQKIEGPNYDLLGKYESGGSYRVFSTLDVTLIGEVSSNGAPDAWLATSPANRAMEFLTRGKAAEWLLAEHKKRTKR